MAKIYRIHPAIGVARVGGSPAAFFLAPEVPGGPAIELNGAGETPLTTHKDGAGLIKRQGVRFRVFEFERSADGSLSQEKELTSSLAQIEWKVEVANRKAAGNKILLPDTSSKRNATITDRTTLAITPGPLAIGGAGQPVKAFSTGKFRGESVFLGDIRTDSQGRLIFCGGHGKSASVPAGKPIVEFANNDFWHDDVCDGPVTATITFPGQSPKAVDSPAWVISGPPDYAPEFMVWLRFMMSRFRRPSRGDSFRLRPRSRS